MEKAKKIVEHEIFKSDRVSLIGEANDFVSYMVHKMRVDSSIPNQPDRELTAEENKTYEAALELLRTEFESGANPAARMEKRVEEESEITPD